MKPLRIKVDFRLELEFFLRVRAVYLNPLNLPVIIVYSIFLLRALWKLMFKDAAGYFCSWSSSERGVGNSALHS